jgi:hypothetical protein
MSCHHAGYREIETTYDQSRGVLVYHWRCDACGKRLGVARRETYRPQFDPHGNDRFRTAAAH